MPASPPNGTPSARKLSRKQALGAAALGAGAISSGLVTSEATRRSIADQVDAISGGRLHRDANVNTPVMPIDDLGITGFPPRLGVSTRELMPTLSLGTALGPQKPLANRASQGGSLQVLQTEAVVYTQFSLPYTIFDGSVGNLVTLPAAVSAVYGIALTWASTAPVAGTGPLTVFSGVNYATAACKLVSVQLVWTAGGAGNAIFGQCFFTWNPSMSLSGAPAVGGAHRISVQCTQGSQIEISGVLYAV